MHNSMNWKNLTLSTILLCDAGADGKERLTRHSRTSHITVVTRDKGSGCVRVDKHGIPKLQYTISSYDEESLVAGLVQSLRILIAAGAVEVGTQQLEGERFKAQGKQFTSWGRGGFSL